MAAELKAKPITPAHNALASLLPAIATLYDLASGGCQTVVKPMTSISGFDDFPVRVLLCNETIPKRVEIATVCADFRTGGSGT